MTTRDFTIDELDVFRWDSVLVEYEGKGRWSEHSTVVFKAEDDKLYVVALEEGLTEYQDYTGADRYPDWHHNDAHEEVVTCSEVEIYEEMVPQRKWRAVT